MIAAGKRAFAWNCSVCHANRGVGAYPNLLNMTANTHDIFDQIVLEGLLKVNGMPSFEGALDEEEVAAIHAYLIDGAWNKYLADNPDADKEIGGGLNQH